MTAATIAGQAPTLTYIALYTMVGHVLLQSTDRVKPHDFQNLATIFLSTSMPVLFFAIVVARFLHVGFHQRAKHPIIALPVDIFRFLTSPPRLILGMPLVISLCLFVRVFTDIKYNIPTLAPYSWDETFMNLDQWLHFGYHPHELLQPVLGHPLITLALDIVYQLWFMIMWMFWVVLAFALRPSVIRTQFFAVFVLIWSLGGSLAAIGFSSVGPCFYGPLGLAPNPYAPLMDYLHQVNGNYHLFSVQAQHLLWQA
ncbi:hypothetical protein GCM10007276_15120 [Agaricicola taiwanensis]|uniref:Acyltransferase 3 domain-containing protein n=1 Tax=Agaricicola taiwanensis TaxID=591372 RepID=A0A8J2YEU1_9RHOB|nr:hypothetical protein GCM10007276_15120 [Agaricicola taiwanensis]